MNFYYEFIIQGDTMNLIIARLKSKLTQKQLAVIVGVSHVTICKLEKGNIDSIKVGTLKKIARALDTDLVTLFFSSEE